MEIESTDKIERILDLYTRLMNGAIINKAEEAGRLGVNERSIQRDIDDIRNYLEIHSDKAGMINSVIYDRSVRGYRLEQIYKMKLTNPEILGICKILLDSRAFKKDEMTSIIARLIDSTVPLEDRKLIETMIRNEEFHYIELKHKSVVLDKIWDISQAIQSNNYIEIKYQGIQGSTVKTRKLKPLAIMFSDYYFYLTAFIDDKKVQENFSVLNDAFPTIYRIDRIQGLKILDEKFHIPYSSRFEEGEFRKRVQFMFGGKLRRVRFEYSGYAVDSVLDKLPTATIEKEEDGVYTISAEVFGDGIDIWFRSQGDNVKVLQM